ncbi:diguanylate cyclase domain-containing protein [Aquibacillus kalidii]
MDVGYFKYLNDNIGYFIGTDVLVILTNVVNDSIRKDDISFRLAKRNLPF